jgi:hypothetical protein
MLIKKHMHICTREKCVYDEWDQCRALEMDELCIFREFGDRFDNICNSDKRGNFQTNVIVSKYSMAAAYPSEFGSEF